MEYNTKTVSTQDIEELEIFFKNLTPGDYIFMSGYYAIFIGMEGDNVILYDVGVPLSGGKENTIRLNTI